MLCLPKMFINVLSRKGCILFSGGKLREASWLLRLLLCNQESYTYLESFTVSHRITRMSTTCNSGSLSLMGHLRSWTGLWSAFHFHLVSSVSFPAVLSDYIEVGLRRERRSKRSIKITFSKHYFHIPLQSLSQEVFKCLFWGDVNGFLRTVHCWSPLSCINTSDTLSSAWHSPSDSGPLHTNHFHWTHNSLRPSVCPCGPH